jgi:cob(I)alamin adenosyltransferase
LRQAALTQTECPLTHTFPYNKVTTRQGLITIFTGDGRGKTSAAIGLAVRAAGHGLKVLIVFFMKGNLFIHGEMLALRNIPGITLSSFGQNGWIKEGQIKPEENAQALKALAYALEQMLAGKYNLIVLDEINYALDFGLLAVEDVIKLLNQKPDGVDLVLTGRRAYPCLMDMADTVTEMVSIKHAFNNGIKARQGIDY